MGLNEDKEFSDVSENLGDIDFSSFFGNGNSSNCGFEVAGSDVKPLIDLCSLEEVRTVELVSVGGSQETDNGVGGEEERKKGGRRKRKREKSV